MFSASANGGVLSGLANRFALTVGTDAAAACGVVWLEDVSPGQYPLNSSDPRSRPRVWMQNAAALCLTDDNANPPNLRG